LKTKHPIPQIPSVQNDSSCLNPKRAKVLLEHCFARSIDNTETSLNPLNISDAEDDYTDLVNEFKDILNAMQHAV
jgi:hypothetical protein